MDGDLLEEKAKVQYCGSKMDDNRYVVAVVLAVVLAVIHDGQETVLCTNVIRPFFFFGFFNRITTKITQGRARARSLQCSAISLHGDSSVIAGKVSHESEDTSAMRDRVPRTQ